MQWEENRTNFDRNLAVVIGINRYSNGIHELKTAVDDAIAIADLLEKYAYKKTDIIRLLDGEATQTGIENLLSQTIPNQLKPTSGDRLIFYYAGHGIPRNSKDGPAGYLVPQDADLNKADSFLSMQYVYKQLNQLTCHHLLVILDCCFAGTFQWAGSRKLIPILETVRREHYDRFIRFPAWQVITSSAHDQEAMDVALDNVVLAEDNRGTVTNSSHSPFALALIEGLQDNRADLIPDGVVTAHELYLYLEQRVSELSKERQNPGLYPLRREYDRGEFIFTKPGFTRDQLKPAPPLDENNNPYRGLKSFDEKHAQFFFGRQVLIEELAKRLLLPNQPLAVVLGVSGSGKSSLVKAGLIPYLRDKQVKQWYILEPMRPGELPFTSLARVLLPVVNANLLEQLSQVSFLDEALKQVLESKTQADRDLDRADGAKPESDRPFQINDTLIKVAELWSSATPEAKLLLIEDYLAQLETLCLPEERQLLVSLHDEILASLNWLLGHLQQNPQYLIAALKTWSQNHPNIKLLLVIDQFEELITASHEGQADSRGSNETGGEGTAEPKQWQPFLEMLRGAIAACPEEWRVVLTLRSDFEPRFLDSPLKSYWKDARFPVRAMNSDELRQAIEGPALKQALYFEPPELVGKLIDEVGQMPGALPLLSFTLSELYIKLRDRWVKDNASDRGLRIKDYEELGGVAGALTRRATEEYDNLVRKFGEVSGKAYQATMRRVMLRMVTIEGGGVARRRVSESELVYPDSEENKRVAQVSDYLVKARLLVKGQETGEPYVEPAHDFLVRGWDKLQEWIKEEQENLVLQQRLTPQADDWCRAINTTIDGEQSEQAIGFLWNSDPRLEQLKEVFEAQQEKNWLNQWEAAFVKSSLEKKKAIEEDLRQQLQREKRLRVTAELREQAARIENLLTVNPKEALGLAIQSLEQNLQYREERVLDRLLVPVQASLNRIIEAVRLPNSFTGHNQVVTSVIFNPENKIIASASRDSTVRLWDLEGNPLKKILIGEQGVNSIAFSPDGKLIVGGCGNGILYLWSIDDLSTVQSLKGHQNSVTTVAFSPDGKFIVSGSEDNTLCLWKLESEFVSQPFYGHEGKITSVAFSPDSKLIVSGSKDNTVRLWDLDGTTIGTFQHDWVTSVAISPDGKLIASSSDYSPSYYKVHLWDLEGNLVSQLFAGHEGNVNSVAFSPDSQLVLIGGRYSVRGSSEVLLSDLKGNSVDQHFQSLTHDIVDGEVFSITFSSDGKWIACGCSDGRVCLWDMQGNSFDRPLPAKSGQIVSLTFNSNNTRLIAESTTGQVAQLWNLEGNSITPLLAENTDSVYSAAFSPDGKWIACGGYAKVQLCDVHGNSVGQPFERHSYIVNSVAFSPDSELIVSSSHDAQTICLWNLEGKLVSPVIKKFGATLVTFSPDGKLIVGSGCSGTRLWTLDGKPFGHSLNSQEVEFSSVAFSPDGKCIITGCKDGKVRLWNTEGEPVGQPFEEHDDPFGGLLEVKLVAASLDGELIASSKLGRMHLWNIGGQLLKPLETRRYLESLAFSPDSKLIIGTCNNGLAFGISRVHLWDLNGNCIDQSFQEYGDWVDSIVFSPDGKLIVCGSSTVRVWSTDRTPISQPLTGHKGRVTTVAFSPDGKLIASGDTFSIVRLWRSSWQAWLKVCCNRLAFNLISENPEIDIQQKIGLTCIKYAWTQTDVAKILLRQANDLSRQGKTKEARIKFEQALDNVIVACHEVFQEVNQQITPRGTICQLSETIPKSSKEEIRTVLELFKRILFNPDEKYLYRQEDTLRAHATRWYKTLYLTQSLFAPEELAAIFTT